VPEPVGRRRHRGAPVSVEATDWAWDVSIPRRVDEHGKLVDGERSLVTRKLVLLAYATHANKVGVCFPSQGRIAAMCGIGERAVRAHVAVLEKAGLLKKSRRRRANGGYAATLLYELALDSAGETRDKLSRRGDNLPPLTGTDGAASTGTDCAAKPLGNRQGEKKENRTPQTPLPGGLDREISSTDRRLVA
jgi:DNA-binding transcriptional ArsR family regulator